MMKHGRWQDLSDDERVQLLRHLIESGRLPRRGRPKKDGSGPLRWEDLGLTRMEIYYWRRLAEIPDFERIQCELWSEFEGTGKRLSRRAYLVKAGVLKNVSDENIFDGTEIGALAASLLETVERFLQLHQPNRRGRRWLMRALHVRLRQIERTCEVRE
jgi:hypothetical protein